MKNLHTPFIDKNEPLVQYLQRMNRVYRNLSKLLLDARMANCTVSSLKFETFFLLMDWADDLCRWRAGDEIMSHSETAGLLVTYNKVAAAIKKSDRWALELKRVSAAFPPTGDNRYVGVHWQLYRICASSKNPVETLLVAIEDGLTPQIVAKQLRIASPNLWKHEEEKEAEPEEHKMVKNVVWA